MVDSTARKIHISFIPTRQSNKYAFILAPLKTKQKNTTYVHHEVPLSMFCFIFCWLNNKFLISAIMLIKNSLLFSAKNILILNHFLETPLT